ncbi:hypothetical protein [Janthinobacterium sp. NKUCC06_STL]|uniref:hypothetical protein n=1 Tax=Janthinobacterium sp. NKUCC06_STL TaxID=2842127 RepID=UPI00214B8B22|nr:hypothetical protein [Janthinobacterium sp. NKUCC06_STL]
MLINILVSACFVAIGIAAYDRLVLRPMLVIGVVDAANVFNAKQEQYIKAMTSSHTDIERRQAISDAERFVTSFATALAQLPDECQCLVVDKTAVIGSRTTLIDLTPLLRKKVKL